MSNKQEMITALESHYKAALDRKALDVNSLIGGGNGDSLDLLIDSIEEYTTILNQFNFVQKLKEKLITPEDQHES